MIDILFSVICSFIAWISLLTVDCSFVGGSAKNVCVFFSYLVVVVAFDMITYMVMAQSFLTSILRVGVCIISLAHFHSCLSSWVLSSALTGSDAILAWV